VTYLILDDGIERTATLAETAEIDVRRSVMPTVAEYTAAVQEHLDAKAREHHYDDIVSACSYAGAPNPFQTEGIAFVTWRGACWTLCYSLMAEVNAGTRQQPTILQLVAAMPVFAP
jgi:hypothetical protein